MWRHTTKCDTRIVGFSLLELLIVLAILGILLGVVCPDYNQHMVKVRRVNVTAVLLDLAGRLEQFYIRKNSYAGASLAQLGVSDVSYTKYYQVDIRATSDSYLLTALPIAGQAQTDRECGALSLDQEGNKTVSGYGNVANCWL